MRAEALEASVLSRAVPGPDLRVRIALQPQGFLVYPCGQGQWLHPHTKDPPGGMWTRCPGLCVWFCVLGGGGGVFVCVCTPIYMCVLVRP